MLDSDPGLDTALFVHAVHGMLRALLAITRSLSRRVSRGTPNARRAYWLLTTHLAARADLDRYHMPTRTDY